MNLREKYREETNKNVWYGRTLDKTPIVNTAYVEWLEEQLNIHIVVSTLKGGQAISFEDWKKRHIIDTDSFSNFLHDTEGWVAEHKLIDMYNYEVMNL